MSMTFASAARKILEAAAEPLHAEEIARRAIEQGLVLTEGKTPNATMYATLFMSIKRNGMNSPFVKVGPSTFGLSEWQAGDEQNVRIPVEDIEPRVRTPHYPVYDEVRAVLPVWDGMRTVDFQDLWRTLMNLTGSPQENVDWTDPDGWIPQRLDSRLADIARDIWEGSGQAVNPRHMNGHWRLAGNYGLLQDGPDGTLALTDRGRQFIDLPFGPVEQQLDNGEGLLSILTLVVEKGPASRTDIVPQWRQHLEEHSNIRSDSYVRGSLYQRLKNLQAREFIVKSGTTYNVTDGGLAYLRRVGLHGSGTGSDEEQQLWVAIRKKKDEVRESLHELLREMDPYGFEHVVKGLLEAMGYDEVHVTAQANDKGVDVVGTIEVGITQVKEVIQVKRLRSNVQRPVLDALRGSLHRFGAVRGTIINTGDFSQGTREAALEPGAAPITLINGAKLVDLLMEYGIGVRKREVSVWELDPTAFEPEPDEKEGI